MLAFFVIAAAAPLQCPTENARYVLRNAPEVTAHFRAVDSGPDWPSGLALAVRFGRSGHTYWWLPWNGGTDNRQNIASTTDVTVPDGDPPALTLVRGHMATWSTWPRMRITTSSATYPIAAGQRLRICSSPASEPSSSTMALERRRRKRSSSSTWWAARRLEAERALDMELAEMCSGFDCDSAAPAFSTPSFGSDT